jgi:hypothetical protein
MIPQKRTARQKGNGVSRTGGRLKTILMALRLTGRAPGLLLRAGSSFRRFRNGYVKAAVAEGLPEALARELANQLRPIKVMKDMVRKQRG